MIFSFIPTIVQSLIMEIMSSRGKVRYNSWSVWQIWSVD